MNMFYSYIYIYLDAVLFAQTLGYKVMGKAGLVIITLLVSLSTFGTANVNLLIGTRLVLVEDICLYSLDNLCTVPFKAYLTFLLPCTS